MNSRRSCTNLLTLVFCAGIALQAAAGQSKSPSTPASGGDEGSGYSKPPQNILDVMQAPLPPRPLVSPTHDEILLGSTELYPSIARVSAPYLRLAGVRVEPKNRARHDTPGGYGIVRCVRRLDLVRVADSVETHIALPEGACLGEPAWSADGKRFAVINMAPDSVELFVGEVAGGKAHRIPGVKLNPMLYQPFEWMPDQKTLLVKLVPAGIGAPPPDPVVPQGPSIQESNGQSGESSTYEVRDTLGSKHDEDLFDYYASTQLALVDAATGTITPIGKAANFEKIAPAPDGQHILVTYVHRPYSYVTTYDHFPTNVEVWDISSRAHIATHTIATLPLADRVPIQGVPTGPREFAWRATEPATLIWAEALDGGDWNVKAAERDKVMLLKAPFTAAPVEIARTEQRFGGLSWSEKPGIALLRPTSRTSTTPSKSRGCYGTSRWTNTTKTPETPSCDNCRTGPK
jgi:dipeptidyl aminopeptidase/acylaminoacyl peptidase